MAKKITSTEGKDENIQDGMQQSATEKQENQDTVQPTTEIPPFIDEILKSLSGYETLYVDSHGGTYTPGTPRHIRKTAVLYKNPHYKS